MADEEQPQTVRNARNIKKYVKGWAAMLGIALAGASILYLVTMTLSAREEKLIPDAPPRVKLFEEEIRVNRKTGPKPIEQTRWIVSPPVIYLNKKLTEDEVKKVKDYVENRRNLFMDRVDTFLRKQDVEFPSRIDAKEKLENYIKGMLEGRFDQTGHIPAGWITEVSIASFNAGI